MSWRESYSLLIGREPHEGLEIKTTRLTQYQSQRNAVTEGLVCIDELGDVAKFRGYVKQRET